MELDRNLIEQAQRFINAANVHFVKTWIYCYETSRPGSARRERYEALLRDFVSSRCLLEVSRHRIQEQNVKLDGLIAASTAINQRIEKLLTSSSD